MTLRLRFFPAVICFAVLISVPSFAQAQEQPAKLPPNATSLDIVANELGLLRRSLQTLNTRLREISEKVLAPGAAPSRSANDNQNPIAVNLDVLTRAEQRAEVLRKLLLELIEKETSLRSRLTQIEEEIRPESIERAMVSVGSTRTLELRDTRRRVLENERKGLDSLLNQTAQNRIRLDDDVKQADALVFKIRQRILPVIDKELDKLTPN